MCVWPDCRRKIEKGICWGFCKLAFGHYEELPMGYRRLVDGYLDGERGENLMVWYLTRHTPWKNARYELHRPDLFLRMAKLVEFTDRGWAFCLILILAACLCMAFSVRSLSDPNSESCRSPWLAV